MYILSDFASKIPIYNPKAPVNSEEDRKYWQWHDKRKMQLERKHKSPAETQFDGDEPVIVVGNKTYDAYGRLKQQVPVKKKGWFW